MRNAAVWISVALLGTGVAFCSAQAATYQLDAICSGGTCTTVPSFGTVTVTGTSTSLSYTFNITNGGDFHATGNSSGLDTLVADVGGTVTNVSFSNTSFNFVADTGTPNADGLGGPFTEGAFCTNPASGGACGTTVTETFTGTGLFANFITTGGLEIFAGADITCVFSGASTCPNNPTFNTGMVGATPLPGALALLFGPVLGAGYLTSRRRRRTSKPATA